MGCYGSWRRFPSEATMMRSRKHAFQARPVAGLRRAGLDFRVAHGVAVALFGAREDTLVCLPQSSPDVHL